MKSRTSFSKLTPFRKDITRFAPIWALYLIGMMLVLLDSGSYYDYDRYARNFVGDLIPAFSVVNLIYAGIVAAALFGDLYNTKMCYSLHAMPQRREHWLLSHLAAGMLFSLVPNTVAALYLMTQLQSYWFIALYWLLAVTLQYVFFFGLATLSAMLTGNRFAMLLVYAGFNFVSMLAYALVEVIYIPMLPGVVTNMEFFTPYCPTWYMIENLECFEFTAVDVLDTEYHEYRTFYEYAGLGSGWGYMAITAAVGAGMMGLSFLVYRLRHLESAGDFIAFPKLHGLACLIMTVCVAVVFGLTGELMGSGYAVWMCVGVAVGYFGSLMLLERRIKVFRPKVFAWFGVLCAAIIASVLMISFDVFGIVDWTPKAEQVEYVTISNYMASGGYYDGMYYENRISLKLEEDEDIAAVITAHEDILGRLNDNTTAKHYVVLKYKLHSGRTVTRAYYAPASGVNYDIISGYFYTPQSVLGYDDWDTFVNGLCYMSIDGENVPEALYSEFIEAARLDCEKGAVTTYYNSDSVCSMEYETVGVNGTYIYRSLNVTSRAENILSLLKSPAFAMGYTGSWEDYIGSVCYVSIDWYESSATFSIGEWDGLLRAVLADCEEGNISISRYHGGEYCLYLNVEQENGEILDRWLSFDKNAQNTIDWLTIHGYLEGGC